MLLDEHRGRRAGRFTLQWHLTHACDLHCKHCYDRTRLSVLRFEDALAILDDFEAFCRERQVRPGLLLSGGNPFFYPWFFELWKEVARRGIRAGILGNPVPREQLERLVAIAKPGYFQVSLEGLREHNDCIRGEGNFERVLQFLPLLREHGIQAVVMTTLTDANVEQVVPLGRLLRDRADRFTFNRLSQVGEGARLGLPDKARYGRFLVEYMVEAKDNPVLGFKDNLFNILRHELGRPLYGGCTGFGCGAAFNFVAVLPDGAVHACRKFPSPIGRLPEQRLADVYDSPQAERYRRGSSACAGCPILHRCGGCLAVVHGAGGDPFSDLDPHCFMHD